MSDTADLVAIPFDYSRAITVALHCDGLAPLCPVNGKSDRGSVHIVYQPDGRIVEYESFARYIASFRDQPLTHELITVQILHAVEDAVGPAWVTIETSWAPVEGVGVTVVAGSGG